LQQKMLLPAEGDYSAEFQQEPMDYASRKQQDSPASRAAPCPAVFCGVRRLSFRGSSESPFLCLRPSDQTSFSLPRWCRICRRRPARLFSLF